MRLQIVWVLAIIVTFSPTVSSSQTATDLMTADPSRAYASIKRSLSTQVHADIEVYADGKEFLPLGACENGATLFPTNGKLRATLVELAFTVLFADAILRRFNYPRSSWAEPLQRFEREQLRAVRNGFRVEGYASLDKEKLAADINRQLKSSGSKRPPIQAEAECGGPELIYQVQIRPRGAQAHLLMKMFHTYCRNVGIDPMNAEKCDLWLPPIGTGDKLPLGGEYYYRIENRGRLSAPRVVDVDRYAEDEFLVLPR